MTALSIMWMWVGVLRHSSRLRCVGIEIFLKFI